MHQEVYYTSPPDSLSTVEDALTAAGFTLEVPWRRSAVTTQCSASQKSNHSNALSAGPSRGSAAGLRTP
jgi:hypothetical protein